MTDRDAALYTTDPAIAAAIAGVPPRRLAQDAMAVYYDRKGRPFAWQVRFDARRWKEAVRKLSA
jgi:hypothetical protein